MLEVHQHAHLTELRRKTVAETTVEKVAIHAMKPNQSTSHISKFTNVHRFCCQMQTGGDAARHASVEILCSE
jgi:hypothetical protein